MNRLIPEFDFSGRADLRAAISINQSERVTERLDFGTMAARRLAATLIGEGSL